MSSIHSLIQHTHFMPMVCQALYDMEILKCIRYSPVLREIGCIGEVRHA